VGRALSGAYAEYRWYAAIGASDVWNLRFVSGALLRSIAFVIGTAIAFVNLWGVRHSVVSLVLPRRLGNIEIGEEVPGKTLMAVVAGIAVLMGTMFALVASDWQGFELALRGVPFNESVPYFDADIGFFVYWLPFERSMYAWMVCVVAIVTVAVVVLYALTPSLRWERGRIHVSTYVRRHIAVLGGIAIVLLAWSFRLEAYDTLTNGSGPDGAFGSFDREMGVPIAMILAYAAIGCGFVVSWAGWTGQSRVALTVLTVLLLLTPTMQYLLPLAVKWSSAPVDPILRERAYAADRAGFTRRAFGLERICVDTNATAACPRPAAGRQSALSSVRHAASVSVWDPVPLARAVERTRQRGSVVALASLAMSPAGPVLVSIERPVNADEPASAAWSVVRTLAAVTDERGTPGRVDEEGRFPLEEQTITDVYVYEGARGSLVVSSVDNPPAAPQMESFGARLAEAWNQQNFRLLSSPTTGARMVRRRDVRERVRAIAPFFAQGTRVIPLVHGDSLLWSVELYSTTADYPLSRRFAAIDVEVSYLRHAAIALVHAHTGRVTIVPDADPDPIALTWMRRLPHTLGRPQELPPSLLALLPPDVDGAEIQAEAFATVGMRGEESVRRHVPGKDGSDTLTVSHAPTFIWLEEAGVPAWTLPLLNDRDRVNGVLVATGGARRELRWYRATDTTMNWGALLERLDRAADDGQSGRDARVAGRVRMLPVTDGSLLAVQPFYGWPREGAPYVQSVVAMHHDSTRVGPSMPALVGAPATVGPVPSTPDAKQERIRVLYAEMRSALQRSDWRAFGAAFDALGKLVDRRER
jgi:uncharacterized membrane protein (UPF0182 family)